MKKILALCLVVVLAATAVVGASMAYLQDDDSAVNVMTLGNVDIELIEQQRNENGELEPFEDNKTLYPIVGSAQGEKDKWGLPTAANYVDKIVSVANTGASDAYIRVLVAVPAALENDDASKNALHWNFGNRFDVNGEGTYNEGTTWQPDYDYAVNTEAQVEMDGITYNVYSFIYNKALAPEDTFDATIIGFYLDENLDNEDGQYVLNGNVIDYDISKGVYIPVMAQAIQAAGFETAAEAFAASGMPTNPWGNTVVVTSAQGLKDAMLIRGANIVLSEDIIVDADTPLQWGAYMFVANGREVTIDLNGKSIVVEEDASLKCNGLFTTANGGTLNIVGDGTIEVKNAQSGIFHAMNKNDQINVYGGTYISNSGNGSNALAIIYTNSGNVDVYGGKFCPLDGIECANAEDIQGDRLSIVFHEGTLLKHDKYYAGYDATRIQLEEGCTLQQVVIDGVTWYKVVKA